MAVPTLHASTPALVASASGNSFTTASFSPPAGTLLVVFGWGHHGGSTATEAVSNSGTALTWTLVRQQNVEEGVVAAWVTYLSAARTGLTVTTTSSNAFQGGGTKVYVVDGVDSAAAVGDIKFGTSTALSFTTTALIPQAADSLLFVGASNDESANSTAPTSSDSTSVSAKTVANQGIISGYRSGPAAGVASTFNLATTTATVRNWNWVSFEVRALVTSQSVSPTAIGTGETFGAASVTVGSVSVAPTAIGSGEVFGTATLQLTLAPTAIASGEAFGTPTVNVTGVITPVGIPSGEAFGTPGVSPQHVSPPGIESGEAFGAPSLTLTITVAGIASEETFGSPSVSLAIYPAAIPTGETFGAVTVSPGPVAITPAGIDTGEQFGAVDVFITLDPTERIRPVRVRVVPLYEVVVVGRVPAPFGPPTFDQVDPLDWAKITWSSTLSRPQRLSVTCKTSTITEPVAQRLRNPDRLATELWVSRNGRRVFAGPLLGGARNGDELTLECGGLLTYLQWMIVNADLRFDQVDQFAITTALIDQWQNLEFGHFGIDTTAVGASGVLRDRSYVRNEIHQVARRVEELGAVRDGFDAEVDPTTRKLQLWYPGKGVDRSTGDDAIVFDGRNIDDQNAMFSIGPADLASHAFGSGSKSGGDSTLWSEQFNADLRAAFGRAAITAAFSDVELQGTLDDHVGALLDARDQPLRAPGQKVRVPVDADLDAYDVGDTVSYELDDLLGIGGAWRIRSRTVNVATTGSEAVDLEFV